MGRVEDRRQSTIPGLSAEFVASNPGAAARAGKWLELVTTHRRQMRAFGRVVVAVCTLPTGEQIHLTEETTFKATAGAACPLREALSWLGLQAERRQEHGLSGAGRLEFEDRAGVVTAAKVVETTVIDADFVDATAPT